MIRRALILCVALLLISRPLNLTAQQSPPSSANPVVPQMIRFNGTLQDGDNKPLSGTVGVTFFLYQEQQGGAPLWMETQNVQADKNGRYVVMLGSRTSTGLPTELFVSGEARWLGVQVQGQPEQTRVMLLSVPYALKAGDAQTIGGLPPSAFVLAGGPTSDSRTTTEMAVAAQQSAATGTKTVTTAGGTINMLTRFDGTTDITNSQIVDNGANVGIGNSSPAAKLDVNGAGIFRGSLSLPATAAATASAGKGSQPLNFTASAFNSTSKAAVNETFRWQSEAVGNNTVSPSGKLSLLFGSGTTTPAETGLSISDKGVVSFVHGQPFPGAGTITGVTAGTGLTGGGTSGKVTLNLDTSKIPQLTGSNLFTGPQSITNSAAADALTVNNNASGGYGIVASGNGGGVFATANNIGTTGIFGANVANTGNGIGVQGFSVGGTGIYGSTSGVSGLFNGAAAVVGDTKNYFGVWGLSAVNDGVHGINGSGAAGLAGENKGQGYGVWAIASNSNTYGVGVRGESFGNAFFPNGNGSDGVDGFAHSANGSGVAGVNTTAGPGVYGHSSGGWGFTTDSNVNQSRNMGGWVKAMAFVDPFAPGGIAVTRCFNSQANGGTVSIPPCGISINHIGQGVNLLDFGFQVNDRFVLITGAANPLFVTSNFSYCSDCTSVNQVETDTFQVNSANNADAPFAIFVF